MVDERSHDLKVTCDSTTIQTPVKRMHIFSASNMLLFNYFGQAGSVCRRGRRM